MVTKKTVGIKFTSANTQLHEIEHDESVTQWDDYRSEIPSRFLRHGTSYDH
jgi:hypothetical protein